MQTVGAQLTTVLQARDRDLITVYEIYDADYQPAATGFDPRDAEETFAGSSFTLPFGPVVYRREVLQGPSIKKSMGKEFNSVTVRFSNVSRYMSAWVLANEVEQKRLVVRTLSRAVATTIGNDISILSNSAVLFVGRCQKPDGFTRSVGVITAKPDIGTIQAQTPPRRFQASCPLDFKGLECLGSETLIQKSAAYQAATTCNFTHEQCEDYDNVEFFQGTQIVQITSSFVHRPHRGLFTRIINILVPISIPIYNALRSRTTVSNSIHDGTPYGKTIPLIFGRWSKVLVPLQYQDLGDAINFLMAACRGTISDFINLRTLSLNFTHPLGVTEHLGEYGGVGTQTQDTIFPQQGFFSKLAYITGHCRGSDITVEDPAPEIAAVIAGVVPESIYDDVDHDGTGKLAAGTGGVTAPGSSTSPPGTAAANYDTWIASKTPLAYYKLEEAAGPVLTDSSGNAYHGTFNAAAVFQIAGPIETDSPSFGVEDKVGLIGNGLGQPAASGGPLDLRDDFTIVGWGIGGDLKTLVCRVGLAGQNGSMFIVFRNPGRVQAEISFAQTAAMTFDCTAFGTVTGGWNQVVLVRVGGQMSLYLNGCIGDERSDLPIGSIVYSRYNTEEWKLGYSGDIAPFGQFYPGEGTSHVSFYDYGWTADDVADDWATAKLVPIGCPGKDWTDNPVDHTRFVLTEPALLGNDDNSIDDFLSAYAAAYTTGAIKDVSNAERCLLPNTETAKAGIDYKRYNSTGLLGPLSFQQNRTQIPAGVPAREAEYEFFNPSAPPTSLTVQDFYRKRFTCNIEVSEVRKAVDFLYDTIFPTARIFLRWNILGQTVIDNERPADWTTLKVASIVSATSLTVQDVLPWKNILGSPYLLEGKIRIGVEYSWSYDTAAIRAGATGFFASDIGKFALQLDNKTVWQLTAITPTWVQITQDTSEVRGVTLAEYSSLGDAITLAASASGGPVATASGGTLTGGSTSVQSSGTVTITGTLADGATITVTINGIASVLDLITGDSNTIIGHRMAAVINANPAIQEYVEAHAVDNVVTIYSKIGVLTLSSALENAHDVGAGITRAMMSFAWKALTYADTTNASILDGTFGWPHASRQSLVNQIKAKHREAILDFGEQPVTVNDFNHQKKTRKENTFEVDFSAVDNHNQASRLSNGLLNKLRDGDQFFNWSKMGEAMLLDEGDVVCVTDSSGPFRNQLVRIEEIQINNDLEVSFIARKYSRLQLSDLAAQPASLILPSALTNFESAPPNIAFNTADFPPDGLVQATDGTAGITSIRGGAIFGASIYGQYARVRLIKRAGVTVDELVATITPNSDLEAVFEFLASADGLYTVELEVCSTLNICNTTKPTASIIIGFGSTTGIAKEGGLLILKEGGTVIMEKEH